MRQQTKVNDIHVPVFQTDAYVITLIDQLQVQFVNLIYNIDFKFFLDVQTIYLKYCNLGRRIPFTKFLLLY